MWKGVSEAQLYNHLSPSICTSRIFWLTDLHHPGVPRRTWVSSPTSALPVTCSVFKLLKSLRETAANPGGYSSDSLPEVLPQMLQFETVPHRQTPLGNPLRSL